MRELQLCDASLYLTEKLVGKQEKYVEEDEVRNNDE